jgi:phage tail-like protein
MKKATLRNRSNGTTAGGKFTGAALAAMTILFLAASDARAEEGVKDRFAFESSGKPLDSFSVEVEGKVVGVFRHCSGLGSESEVLQFRSGGDSRVVQKLPGPVSALDVICRRSVNTEIYFWDWRAQVEQGAGNVTRDAAVNLLDSSGSTLARWELFDAWPSKAFVDISKNSAGHAEEVIVLTVLGSVRTK